MKIALVNSRKPRQFHPDEPWLVSTMALGYAIACRGHTLCASVGTIGYDAALFGAAMGDGRIEAFVSGTEEAEVSKCFPQGTRANLVCTSVLTNNAAQRDRDVIDAADLVIAVAVRAGGQMESLLQTRWSAGKKVQVVVPADERPLWRGTRKLLEMGVPAVSEDLMVLAQERMALRALVRQDEPRWGSFFSAWRDEPLASPTLSHFTRAAEGRWPGQSHADYLEDLWHGGLRARRDASAALWRIVQSQVLKASSRLIRGGFPVVSFTAAAPERLDELHRYRAHLVRWDFEPWGIVFDRDWLAKRQARPVNYLSSASFTGLTPDERPWFQKHEPPACDYSAEEEWRILGDLDFSDAPRDAVRLVIGP